MVGGGPEADDCTSVDAKEEGSAGVPRSPQGDVASGPDLVAGGNERTRLGILGGGRNQVIGR